MRKCLLFSLFLIFSTLLQAQNATADSLQLLETQMNIPADSLEAQLLREKEDTSRVGLLGYLCFYYAWVDPRKALEYGQQGLQLSHQLDYKRGSAYCKQSLSSALAGVPPRQVFTPRPVFSSTGRTT
jgi:hypothetical protein